MRVTRLDAHGAKIFHRVVIPMPTFFFVFLKNYGFTQDARETEKGVYTGGSDARYWIFTRIIYNTYTGKLSRAWALDLFPGRFRVSRARRRD